MSKHWGGGLGPDPGENRALKEPLMGVSRYKT